MKFISHIILVICWTSHATNSLESYQDILFSARCIAHCDIQNVNTIDLRSDFVADHCYDECKLRKDWELDFTIRTNTTDYMLHPAVLCQELTKTSAKVVLSWRKVDSVTEGAVFLVECLKHVEQPNGWQVAGITQSMFIEVPYLYFGQKYRFRVTAVFSLTLISLPLYSDWILISKGSGVISAPSDIEFDYVPTSDNMVDVFVSWVSSKDSPCSYDLTLLPDKGVGNFQQKMVSLPFEKGSVAFPNLLPSSNYSLEITPYDPSGMLSVKSIKTYFTTECRYFPRDDYPSDTCNDDSPQNLTATWITNSSEVFIEWLAPKAVIQHSLNATYKIFIWKDFELPGKLLFTKLLPMNVTELYVEITDPVMKLIIELYAVVDGYNGLTVNIQLQSSAMGPQEPNKKSRDPQTAKGAIREIWIISIVSLILVGCFIVLMLWLKQRYAKKPETEDFLRWKQVRVPERLKPYVIPSHQIFRHEELGHGAFGVVYKGTLTNTSEETIAMKEFLSIESLIQEADIMENLGRHRHIVSLRGICIDSDPVCLLLEYCPLGDLHTWLRNMNDKLNSGHSGYNSLNSQDETSSEVSPYQTPISSQTPILGPLEEDISLDLFENRGMLYIYQVAIAMMHIASNKMLHRDISARNVLLYSNNIVKLADFGLSRDVYEDTIYVIQESRRLPIRWMAIETLETQIFTLSSDVWSFGVLMWEVMSFGAHPYSGVQNNEILTSLQQGRRLEKPKHCNTDVYNIMKSCWLKEPKRRPSFMELKYKLERILEEKNYMQL